MKKILLLMTIVLGFIFTSCTSTTERVTPLERAQMRTATIEGNYKITFKAMMTTLENEGYTIENTDMDSGLIVSTIVENPYTEFDRLWGTTGTITSTASATISKINNTSTRVRINLRKEKETHRGAYVEKDASEVNDPLVYKEFFTKLNVEIARARAIM